MANVLLGVTGSVAATKTPELLAELRRQRHHIKIVATTAALYFFDPAALTPGLGKRDPALVILDEDEWPDQQRGGRYQRGDPVLHIELPLGRRFRHRAARRQHAGQAGRRPVR